MTTSVIGSPAASGQPEEPGRSGPRRDPTWTWRETRRAGLVDRDTFREAEPLVDLALSSGAPESGIPDIVGHTVAKPYIRSGEGVLRDEIDVEVIPLVAESAQRLEEAKTALDGLDGFPHDISAEESGTQYGGHSAVRQVDQLTSEIEDDRAIGRRHHERVPSWQHWVRRLAPWADALGLLVFITIYLNVPVFAPWVDLPSWTIGVVFVVAATLGLKVTTSRSARHYNAWREQVAERQKHEADRSRRGAIRYGVFASLIALVVTTTLVLRGSLALDDAGFAVTAAMISLAFITGIVVPALAWWAEAHDGSSVSRERDQLASDLKEDLLDHQDLRRRVGNCLDRSEAIAIRILNDLLPGICDDVQTVVNDARHVYAWVCAQVGLTVQPPPPAPPVLETVTASPGGRPMGAISTGIPGADTVDLQPIWDVISHLQHLQVERSNLRTRLLGLADHPWDHASR